MRRYLDRFSNSSIQAVFSPITPYVPPKIGSLETFRELHRWFGKESGISVAQELSKLPRGSLGYLYKLPDVGLEQVEVLAKALPEHVHLVGYRELAQLARSKSRALSAARPVHGGAAHDLASRAQRGPPLLTAA